MQTIYWNLKDICELVLDMVAEKYDTIIFITGKRGISKSTLGCKLAFRVGLPFTPTKDIVYTRDEVIKQLSNKKKGVIFADEMINVAYNRDFYETDQKQLLKAFNMYRDSCNLFIGCIPIFTDLDVQMQKLCKIHINVIARGIAIIHTQLPSTFSKDPWDIKNNLKVEGKWCLRGLRKPRYTQLSTYRGTLLFGDLTIQQRNLYEKIKEEKRNRVYKDYQNKEDSQSPQEILYKNLLKMAKDKKLTPKIFQSIVFANGMDYNKVRRKLNEMLRDEGKDERFKDLIKKENIVVKRDALGFNEAVK